MARLAEKPDSRPFGFEGRFESVEPVLDADFETVTADSGTKQKAKPLVATPKQTEPGKADTDKIGMSVFGKKPALPRADDKIAFYGLGTILVALSFWVSGGHALFSMIDRMPVASIKAAGGRSEIADVSWRVVTVDGKTALHINGVVRNSGTVAAHTKPVIVTVKHSNGSTKRYWLGQKGWTLGPGQEVVVSGRLDIASANIASVVIALSD